MIQTPTLSPPRVAFRLGTRTHAAVPLTLDGQTASLALEDQPGREDRARMRLDWDDGRVTELDVDVRCVDGPGCLAYVDIRGVKGDWRPFLEYLGRSQS